jgi:hypothetical protein
MNMSVNNKVFLTESFLKKEYQINKQSIEKYVKENIVITMDNFSSEVVKAILNNQNIDKFFK